MDWTRFKKTFTQEQEDALWQYFIDHSRLQQNGYFGIMFYVKDVDDFWRRVYARHTGEFKRYDKLEKAEKQESLAWSIAKAKSRERSRRFDAYREKGIIQRFIFKLFIILRTHIEKSAFKE